MLGYPIRKISGPWRAPSSCRMSDDERRGVPAVDRRDYAAIATPVTSAQVVNAWLRAE
jgi:hypothetical protein